MRRPATQIVLRADVPGPCLATCAIPSAESAAIGSAAGSTGGECTSTHTIMEKSVTCSYDGGDVRKVEGYKTAFYAEIKYVIGERSAALRATMTPWRTFP